MCFPTNEHQRRLLEEDYLNRVIGFFHQVYGVKVTRQENQFFITEPELKRLQELHPETLTSQGVITPYGILNLTAI